MATDTLDAPASTTTPEKAPLSFLGAFDDLGDVDPAPDKNAAPAPAPSTTPPPEKAPDATKAPDPAPVAIPDAVTKGLTGTTTPPAPAPVDDDWEKKADELFKSKAGEAFGQLKKDLKAARAQLAEHAPKLTQLETVTKELEAAKKNGASSLELDELRAEKTRLTQIVSEAEKELAVTRVEATQEYKSTVGGLFEQVDKTVKGFAEQYQIPKESFDDALREVDPAKRSAKLSQVAQDMSEYDRMRFYDTARTYDTAVQRQASVKENASQALKMIEDSRRRATEAQAAARTEEFKQALDVSAEKLKVIPLLNKVEGNDQWNARLAEMDTWVRGLDFDALPPLEKAVLLRQGASFTLLLDAVQFYATEAQRVQAELAKITKSTPGAGGGAPGATGPSKVQTPGLGFLDAIEQGLAGR